MSGKSDSIFVSNLDSSIGEFELRNEIFTDVGPITSVAINYNKDGASLGTATVKFPTPEAALKAFREFNGAQIDGRKMDILILSAAPQHRTIIKVTPPPVAAPVRQQQPRQALGRNAQTSAPAQQQRKGTDAKRGQALAAAPRGGNKNNNRLPQPSTSNTLRRKGAAPVAASTAASQRGGRRSTGAVAPRAAARPAASKPAQSRKTPAKKAAKAPAKKVSAADLDAQLEKYNAGRPSKESL